MLKQTLKKLLNRTVGQQVSSKLSVAQEYSDEKAIAMIAGGVAELAKTRGFSKIQIFNLFYAINRTLYPEFVINDRGRVLLEHKPFRDYYQRFNDDNWTSFERKWNLKELLRLSLDIPGNFAECGVYRGAVAHLLCEVACESDREVHLFDSYEGLSEPNDQDGDHWTKGDLTASEAVVHENLKRFSCFKTYKGWIPEAFPSVSDHVYAFLHIDVDLEQPTYDSLAFFYPRLNSGGIIVLDDHGYDTCPGARKAALEFMSDKPEPILDLSTGQGLIIKH